MDVQIRESERSERWSQDAQELNEYNVSKSILMESLIQKFFLILKLKTKDFYSLLESSHTLEIPFSFIFTPKTTRFHKLSQCTKTDRCENQNGSNSKWPSIQEQKPILFIRNRLFGYEQVPKILVFFLNLPLQIWSSWISC